MNAGKVLQKARDLAQGVGKLAKDLVYYHDLKDSCSNPTSTVKIILEPGHVQSIVGGSTIRFKAHCAGMIVEIRQRKEGEEIE